MHDIPALLELINGYASQRDHAVVARTEFEMSGKYMRDFK